MESQKGLVEVVDNPQERLQEPKGCAIVTNWEHHKLGPITATSLSTGPESAARKMEYIAVQ